MKGKDLFKGLSYIDAKYVQEAAEERSAGHHSLKKTWLMAAVIAALLLLTGCAAAVYLLHMQDLKMADSTAEKYVFAEDGINIEGTETVNTQVLSLTGIQGSPGYQATKEWYEFVETYDPDYGIYAEMDKAGSIPDFPEEYQSYNLYSQEMKDKLDELLVKYNLKPTGSRLDFRTLQNLCQALNIEKIQTSQNEVKVTVTTGNAYSGGNFFLTMDFELSKEEGTEVDTTWGVLRWNRKDCFSADNIEIEDTGDWKEWNYKTASGSNVLIMRSPSDWRGWILCDRGDAILSLQVEARQDLGYNVDGKSWFEYKYITDKQMEQVADAVDFGIQPKKVSQEDAANQPAPPQEATQDGYTVTLKDIFTDGYTLQVTLGIAAPEGTVIAGETQPGANPDGEFTIMWDNIPSLTHPTRKVRAGDCEWEMQEDGDGKNNTHDLVFEVNTLMQDNEASFVPGETWKLHIEDLKTSFLDKEALAHGEWNFEIPITEDNGDFRELELAPEPITTKVSTGWLPDGTDVMENVKISSFKLHTLGAIYETDSDHMVDFCPSSEKNPLVVMKDGSKVDLRLGGGGAMLVTDTPIDLDQVDYVELIDGTKLPVPQSGENQ